MSALLYFLYAVDFPTKCNTPRKLANYAKKRGYVNAHEILAALVAFADEQTEEKWTP